jgi:hypothetical protein
LFYEHPGTRYLDLAQASACAFRYSWPGMYASTSGRLRYNQPKFQSKEIRDLRLLKFRASLAGIVLHLQENIKQKILNPV